MRRFTLGTLVVLTGLAALVGCGVGVVGTAIYADRNFGHDYYCR